jgi:coenzyme F420-reducing hydrogenase beta subunit
MQPNDLDALYPTIDTDKCVNCGLCEQTCPNNISMNFRYPQKVWAAWSNNEMVRKISASGGVACELYKHWLKIGGVGFGVIYDVNEGCHFKLIEKEADIDAVRNSKYTFSNTKGIYKVVKQKLNMDIPVLFIGVPCQIAGLLGYLKKDYENLFTVDIICHGMPPETYLQQHIAKLEQKTRKTAKKLSFRDSEFGTNTFTFTLRDDSNKLFYKKKVLNTDNYQLSYHRALIYRENCYSCKYARRERLADLTIGDFSGIGRISPFHFSNHNISCILQNTNKGSELLSKLNTALTLVERPILEALNYEKQLNSPSIKHSKRNIFEQEYRSSKNFNTAASKALCKEKIVAIKTALVLKTKLFLYRILVICGLKKH